MRALSVLLIAMLLAIAPVDADAAPQRRPKANAAKKISLKQKAHKVRVRFDAWLGRLKTRLKEAEKKLAKAVIGTDRINGNYAVLAIADKGMTRPPVVVRVQNGKSTHKDVQVKLVGGTSRGVGTYYQVLKPAGAVVVKTKVNVYCRTLQKRLKTPCPTTYVAATVDFRNQALIDDGFAYLMAMARKAQQELRQLKVKSYVYPGRLVADAYSADDVAALAIVEHVDPGEFQRSNPRQRRALIEAQLASLGANRGDTYKFACSPVGACGLPQYMPDSYSTIIALYPNAFLIPWFMAGTSDHLNGLKAMYLHFDWTLNALRKEVIGKGKDERKFAALVAARGDQLGWYHAASYNAGPHRVINKFLRRPRTWHLPGSGLIRQPRVYVEIYRAVKDDMRRRRAAKKSVAGETPETGEAVASRK